MTKTVLDNITKEALLGKTITIEYPGIGYDGRASEGYTEQGKIIDIVNNGTQYNLIILRNDGGLIKFDLLEDRSYLNSVDIKIS